MNNDQRPRWAKALDAIKFNEPGFIEKVEALYNSSTPEEQLCIRKVLYGVLEGIEKPIQDILKLLKEDLKV